MAKSREEDVNRMVNHAELRVLVEHMSALIAGLEVRLEECERHLPVDPKVKAAVEDLQKSVRDKSRLLEFPKQSIALVDTTTREEASPVEPPAPPAAPPAAPPTPTPEDSPA